ncbi:S-adenosyl-L-methionine-dependent methyltransferase [Endogone sp. FLAS-F59071]|nr:S-adenosyl-L-methionine-dependent methyltransferase [Endogone sp. FLAS-F59071]|eukprot:RUS19666.1 S-adenosyl-L-methionine-dependent methyltransferase [Endogone sp. FLAS-F59071]
MGQGQSKIKRRYLSNTSINRVNHPYKTQQQCEQSEKSENSSSASSNQSAQYWIPIDDQEIDRSVMSSAKHCIREGARILDVGCGPGTWVLDAATDYPEADWVGIDINGMFPEMIMPPNVSFVQADVLDGLPFEAGTFDLVQMRLTTFAWTCEEWPIVIGDIFRVLKPGGYIQTIDIGREHSDGPSDPPDPEILKFNYKCELSFSLWFNAPKPAFDERRTCKLFSSKVY